MSVQKIEPNDGQHVASDWKDKVAQKRLERDSQIPKEWMLPSSLWDTLPKDLEKSKTNLMELDIPRRSGLLSDRELDITESYDTPSLLKGLSSGEFTSLEVTIAFSKRAAIAQQLTQCLTETFFEKAQERARHLDSIREKGQVLGPLHGLPISIKDSLQVEGVPATLGIVSKLGDISKANSPLVEILLKLGAVVYVKTNIPQLMMTADSHNNVFGRVLNPLNTMLSAGGSSGGEGALVAFRGSPLGVGTDVAGSIRIPSYCCGTYGFKPTANRVPYGGQAGTSSLGVRPIMASAGPIAHDMASLELFMKTVIDASPAKYDSTAFALPWRSIAGEPKQKLRLGYLQPDPAFPLHPPVEKAVAEAVRILEASGHEIVTLKAEQCHMPALTEISKCMFGLDPSPDDIVTAGGEPPVPSRLVVAKALGAMRPLWPGEMDGLDRLGRLGYLQKKRSKVDEAWRKLWVELELDAVIAPSSQSTAIEHDNFGWVPYTGFLNVLDYPATVIPFGKADTASDHPIDYSGQPGVIVPKYNPTAVDGAPCSIQVFTNRMLDEECIAISKVVDDCLRGLNK